MIRALRILRPIAAVVLFFVTWQFFMVSEFIAWAKEPPRPQRVEHQASVAEKFGKKTEELEGLLKKVRTGLDSGEDISEHQSGIVAVSDELDALNTGIEEEFAATGRKLDKINVAFEIRERQKNALAEYRSQFQELRRRLKSLERNNTRSVDLNRQTGDLELFLEALKPTRSQLDQNKLINRTVKGHAILPKGTREEYQKDERFKSPAKKQHGWNLVLPKDGVQIASASSDLTGMFTVAQATLTEGIQAPTPDDLAATIDAQLTDAIRAKAAELGNQPLPIYQWVRNNVEFVPTYGSIQGADYCLQTLQCNAFDTSSLLIALLRAANIPARYIYGTIEIPADKAMTWVGGVAKPELAVELLNNGGIPAVGVVVGSQATKIRLEHVWIKAFIDYVPSRGAIHRTGDNWIPMDPSWKDVMRISGIDSSPWPSFDLAAFSAACGSGAMIDSAAGSATGLDCSALQANESAYTSAFKNNLLANHPDATVLDLTGSAATSAWLLPIFPSVLPYPVTAEGGRYSALPDSLRHTVRFQLTHGSTSSIDRTEALLSLAGKKISFGYVPATPADQQVIDAVLPDLPSGTASALTQLPASLPAYLIQVRPELRISGNVVATGAAATLGSADVLRVTMTAPTLGADETAASLTAGEYGTLVIDPGSLSGSGLRTAAAALEATVSDLSRGDLAQLTREELLGGVLALTGWAYLDELSARDSVRAGISGVTARLLPAAVLVRGRMSAQMILGIPASVSFGGIGLDLQRRAQIVSSLNGDKNQETIYTFTAGLDAAVLSGLLSGKLLSTEAITAPAVLSAASVAGIPIYTITAANVDTALAAITISAADKTTLRNDIAAGKTVLVPKTQVTIGSWTGSAYAIVDPVTGESGYYLSGKGAEEEALVQGAAWMSHAAALPLTSGADPLLLELYRQYATVEFVNQVGEVLNGVETLPSRLASGAVDFLAPLLMSQASASGLGCLLDLNGETSDQAACSTLTLGSLCLAQETVSLGSENSRPIAAAGADQRVKQGALVLLDGTGSHDADSDMLTYRWTIVSRPTGSQAALTSPAAVQPSLLADSAGSYTLELTVHDGRLVSGPDRVVITATADTTIVPAVAGMTLLDAETALATAGLALGAVEQQAHATIPAWSVIGQSPAAAASAMRSSSVDLVVSTGLAVDTEKPVLTVTLDRSIPVYPAGTSVVATIDAQDNSGTVQVTLEVDGVAKPVTLPLTTIATNGMPVGSRHAIMVTATDPSGNAISEDVSIGILDPSDTAVPLVAITSPEENVEVTAPMTVIGTAFDAGLVRWQLSYAPVGESGETVLAQGTAPITDGALSTFDPTLLRNGLYALRLAVTDVGGSELVAETVVRVAGEMKVGNFTVSFTDLEIPVAGLPVRVVRTYDSRDKGKGDFGIGWRVDFKSVTTQENMTPGRGWYQESDGDPYMPTWCISGEHFVTVTLPEGRSEEFDALPEPQCNLFWPVEEVTVSYTARPGTTSTLRSSNPGPFYFANGTFLDYEGAEVYDPAAYTLTALDGTVYELDQSFGIKKVLDPNGNTVSYGQSGIIHSAGKSIAFTRDGQGRITKITDPDGKEIVYEYDSRGDLESVTDRGGNVTRMSYDLRHNLDKIQDPRGVAPLRNEYDDAGRLIAHVDAHGKRIEYTHDIAGRREIVQDRLGRQTLYVYDDNGRVLAKTDPDGRTVAYTYDGLGNKTSESDPLGNVSRWTYDDKRNLLSETKVLDGVDVTTRHTYTPKGRLWTTTDPLGHVTSNWYDTKGNLLTTTDALGNVTTNTYDARGNLATTTDPLGHTTTYAYDGAGYLLSQTDAEGYATTYTYDTNGNKLTETAPRGGVTRYEYDTSGRQVAVTDALGHATRTEYDKAGTRIAEVDALGVRTTFVYDAAGKLIQTNSPDGTSTKTKYDAEGNRIVSTDQLGRVTGYEYDENKRLVRTIHPDNSTQQYGYDFAGRQTTVTDAAGKVTTKVYDALGRVTKSIDPEGHTTSFTYDLNGTQLTQTDANGHTTTFGHDAAGRVTMTTLPGGESSSVAYDALGRKISETDAAGKITQFDYDARGNLTSVTNAMAGITRYEYDGTGNRTAIMDARGNRTIFVFDVLNRLSSKTMPNGAIESYAFDAAGRQSIKIKPDGNSIQYAYDAQGRLLSRGYPDGSAVGLAYIATGKRSSVTDRRGISQYDYDGRDRLFTHTSPDGQAIGYTYDPEGRIATISSLAGTVSYGYSNGGRLTEVHDPQGRITQYGYDNAGNRTGLTYPNGTTVSYGYDTNNRLRTLEHKNSVAQVIASYAYTIGATGNRTRIDENTGISRAYQYDNLYRLTQDAVTDPAGAQTYTDDYGYDGVGNRLTKSHAAGAVPGVAAEYAYNNADQLLEENGVTYTYDLNGNLKTKTDAAGTTTYSWDYEDRLVEVAGPGGTVTYEYDVDGNRVSSTTSAGTTRYLVDTNRALPQVLAEYTPDGTVLASYVYADDLISMTRGSQTRWYHFDGLGSTRLLTDETGAVTDTYSYDAFGNLIARTGTTQNDFLFTGQQQDANLGFYYLRARYYNSSTGVFASVDPFAGDMYAPGSLHKYLYVSADPVNRIDPLGQMGLLSEQGIGASISGILNTLSVAVRGAAFRAAFTGVRIFTLSGVAAGSAWRAVGRMSAGMQNLIAGPAVRWWGVGKEQINQGILHYYIYMKDPSIPVDKLKTHFERVAQLLKVPPFQYSQTDFSRYTDIALDIVTDPRSFSRTLDLGRTAYFSIVNEKEGIIVFVENGRLQSMFAANWRYFLNLKR